MNVLKEMSTDELIRRMRICCGDINIDDNDCDCCPITDEQPEGLRFCRQWLMKEAADRLEALMEVKDNA